MEPLKAMKSSKHFLECEAPICSGGTDEDYGDPKWKKHVTWFPDELVCKKGPYKKWQKMQKRLQKFLIKGQLKHPYTYYTADMLERRTAIHKGTKGRNPDKSDKGYLTQ